MPADPSHSGSEVQAAADRAPELPKALHLAKVTGVIAKLDRLPRNDSGVLFFAPHMPDANDLTVGIMALVAEQVREAISRRTKEVLAAARRARCGWAT